MTFTVANGGVGYGKISSRAQPNWKRTLANVRAQIASGKIKVTATDSAPRQRVRNRVHRKGRGFDPAPSGMTSV